MEKTLSEDICRIDTIFIDKNSVPTKWGLIGTALVGVGLGCLATIGYKKFKQCRTIKETKESEINE